MQRLANLIRGKIRVEAAGAYPERLINLCAARGLAFWELEWVDGTTIRLTVSFWHWKRLRALARRAMCELTMLRSDGLPAAALRMRRRYVFLAGGALCLLTLCVLSRFVLVVEVTGNERVAGAVILAELERQGVRPGAYIPSLDVKAIANRALMELDELSFLAVNLNGCRAEVVVREAEAPPELLDQDTPADVTAAAAGIVLDVQATAGQALVEEGDTVVEGDVLITGFIDLPEPAYSETDAGIYVVHASGTVTARTWRTLRAVLPLTAAVKEHTGESVTLWSVRLLGRRVNFYQNSGISYDRYDKIIQTDVLTLPGGWELPFSVTRETARAYTLRERDLDRDAAITLLEDGLRRELDGILAGTDGECVRLDYTAAVEDDMLTVTLLAECVEQIGRTVLREGETGFIPGAEDQAAEGP